MTKPKIPKFKEKGLRLENKTQMEIHAMDDKSKNDVMMRNSNSKFYKVDF